MAGANGVDLSGPLAGMWRDVYRKAGAVAEARTQEHLKSHVYVYHPNGAGGGGGGPDAGPWVDEAGDTMTGTLHFDGDEVVAGGAIRVVGPVVTVAAGRGYGAASPVFTPAAQPFGAYEVGLRLRADVAGTVVALRWYRAAAEQAAPDHVRLWDATAPAAPLLEVVTPPEFLEATPGWKEHVLPPGAEVPVVAGRTYAVSHLATTSAPGQTTLQGYTPVPDAGWTFMGHASGAWGTYPDGLEERAWGIDVALGTPGGPGAPALTGAVRLPRGDAGMIAWRNGTGTGDHTLTVDEYPEGSGTDALLFDGVPLGSGGGGGTGNTTMYTQTSAPTGAANSLWFNPSESA